MGIFAEKKVCEYVNDLAAKSSVPGGGSAAALNAAIGVALNLMVINHTIKSKVRSPENSELLLMKTTQEKSLEYLVKLIDDDCAGFLKLMDAIKQKIADDVLYKSAAEAPFNVMRETSSALEITLLLKDIGNKNLISDVVCAYHSLKCGFYSALANVKINIKHFENKKTAKLAFDEIKDLVSKVEGISEEFFVGTNE
ncbi:MAG: cyclodeaminase/cyclohydrolase family protein [Candidatus Omnitrophica bacterium]|nr:cyclodeaminase/cyclohydrolase family protein [Candidatus Omnitrophota bacterium]